MDFVVFVTHISPRICDVELQYIMQECGRVAYINRCVNIAFVQYMCLSEAIRAVENLDGIHLYGWRLFVQLHKENTIIKQPFPRRNIPAHNLKKRNMTPTNSPKKAARRFEDNATDDE